LLLSLTQAVLLQAIAHLSCIIVVKINIRHYSPMYATGSFDQTNLFINEHIFSIIYVASSVMFILLAFNLVEPNYP